LRPKRFSGGSFFGWQIRVVGSELKLFNKDGLVWSLRIIKIIALLFALQAKEDGKYVE